MAPSILGSGFRRSPIAPPPISGQPRCGAPRPRDYHSSRKSGSDRRPSPATSHHSIPNAFGTGSPPCATHTTSGRTRTPTALLEAPGHDARAGPRWGIRGRTWGGSRLGVVRSAGIEAATVAAAARSARQGAARLRPNPGEPRTERDAASSRGGIQSPRRPSGHAHLESPPPRAPQASHDDSPRSRPGRRRKRAAAPPRARMLGCTWRLVAPSLCSDPWRGNLSCPTP